MHIYIIYVLSYIIIFYYYDVMHIARHNTYVLIGTRQSARARHCTRFSALLLLFFFCGKSRRHWRRRFGQSAMNRITIVIIYQQNLRREGFFL